MTNTNLDMIIINVSIIVPIGVHGTLENEPQRKQDEIDFASVQAGISLLLLSIIKLSTSNVK